MASTALAIAAIIVGGLPLLVGAVFLFLDDPAVFIEAVGVALTVVACLALASWGIAYLAGAS